MDNPLSVTHDHKLLPKCISGLEYVNGKRKPGMVYNGGMYKQTILKDIHVWLCIIFFLTDVSEQKRVLTKFSSKKFIYIAAEIAISGEVKYFYSTFLQNTELLASIP